MKCKTNEGSNYDREGQWVIAKYLQEYWVTGKIESSRVKYGGTIQHIITSDSPTFVRDELRTKGTTFTVDEDELFHSEFIKE